jgi:hypothetical protein
VLLFINFVAISFFWSTVQKGKNLKTLNPKKLTTRETLTSLLIGGILMHIYTLSLSRSLSLSRALSLSRTHTKSRWRRPTGLGKVMRDAHASRNAIRDARRKISSRPQEKGIRVLAQKWAKRREVLNLLAFLVHKYECSRSTPSRCSGRRCCRRRRRWRSGSGSRISASSRGGGCYGGGSYSTHITY